MGETWHRFIVQLDTLLEEALRLWVKFSLQVFLQVLRGDGSTGPSPLLKVTLTLSENKVSVNN